MKICSNTMSNQIFYDSISKFQNILLYSPSDISNMISRNSNLHCFEKALLCNCNQMLIFR